MDKKDLTEEDIKAVYITPALEKAGWKTPPYRLMEHYFTDGRVIAQGSMHARQKGKKADYLLSIAPNRPIAIVEAKDNNNPLGGGMQQAELLRQYHEKRNALDAKIDNTLSKIQSLLGIKL